MIKGSVIQFLLSQVRTSTEALIGGKVYFYQPGTTSMTGIKIWLDEEATSAANNPYTLDADATAQIYASGKYRIVIKDALGVTQFDRDDITFFDFDNPYEIDALQYSPNTFTQASIAAALTAIGTTNKVTLLLRPGTWVISSNADWSAYTNVTFKIVPGAIISHGAFTVKMNYPVPGLYQMFSGTGTVTFTSGSFENISPTIFGFAVGTANAAQAIINSNAIQAAIKSLIAGGRGGVVQLPQGEFKVIPDVISPQGDHITIQGVGNAAEYGPTNQSGTLLTFTTGALGIDLSFIDGSSAGPYAVLKDLTINGAGVLDVGVEINGKVLVQGAHIGQCKVAGYKLTGAINDTRIENSSAVNNVGGTGYGVWIADDGSHLNTIMSFSHFLVRDNTVGVRIENAQNLTWRDSVIETNAAEGLQLYKPTGGTLGTLIFENVWFENNNTGTTNYQATITAQVPDLVIEAVGGVEFRQVYFRSFVNERSLHAIATRNLILNRVGSVAAGAGVNAITLGATSLATQIIDVSSSTGGARTCVTDNGVGTVFSETLFSLPYPGASGGRNDNAYYPDALFVTSAAITQGTGTGVTIGYSAQVLRQVYKVTVDYTALAAAAGTADKVIATLPAKTRLVSVIADTTTKYVGGAVTAATIIVGTSTGGADLIASHDVFANPIVKGLADADMGTAMTRAAAIQGGIIGSWTTTTPISVRIATATANTNALTQGSTTYYLITDRF